MDSYIVRIYRRGEKNPRELVGVVENVEVEEKKAFRNIDELWAILASPKDRSPPKRRVGSRISRKSRRLPVNVEIQKGDKL